MEAGDIENAFENGNEIESTIKEEIITLLEDCLPHSAPNVSHYLLGFDITEDIQATFTLQLAVLNSSRNCTEALFTLLKKGIQKLKHGIEVSFYHRRLIQSSWRLLCALYSNDEASEVLRFLRESGQILLNPMQISPTENNILVQTTHEISAPAQKQQHICHVCEKSYTRKDNLKRHLLSHKTQQEKLICFCGTECVSKQVHVKHWQRRHKNRKYQDPVRDVCNLREKPDLFSCAYCKKGFQKKNNLKRHMRTHGYMMEDKKNAIFVPKHIPMCLKIDFCS